MKPNCLTHQYTPDELKQLNSQIERVLEHDELDEARLLDLVSERDTFITAFLKTLTGETLEHFARAELEVNTQLNTHATDLLSATKNSLGKLIKGQKAIKQYK